MASNYTLAIDGIKGESKQKGFEEQIELESFSWGVSNQASQGSGGGGGAGKSSFQDLHFTTRIGKHSPLVSKACATGQHIKKVELFVRKAGGNDSESKPFYKVILEDTLISSFQSGGSEGSNALPVDQFSINYAKIEFNYAVQDEKGKLGSPVIMKYNVKDGKAG